MTDIKQQSLKKNFIFQGLYQIIIFIIPLIISPYLTRALGDTSLGIYSYTNSIVNYFMMFAMLGISNYGQRVIASRRNDKTQLRKTFWSLYVAHVIFSLLSIFIYIIFIFCFNKEDRVIYLIQTLYLVSVIFDITWLFQGLENFKTVVIRNTIVKILECCCIFIFVKHPNDLPIYTLIMSISVCLGQIIMIPQAIHYIKPIKFNKNDMKEHFKPLFILFLSVIASSLYNMFDKTLLGLLSSKENVAYYEYSNKIILIPITMLGVISTVMLPRACQFIANNDINSSRKYMKYSLEVISFIGCGSIFGLLGIGNLFALLYYGKSFAVCGNIIISLTPLVLLIPIGRILRAQYIVPKAMDKWLVISYAINSVVNLTLTLILIPKLGIYGAVIGTIVAEIAGLIVQMIISKELMNIKDILKAITPYVIFGIVMFVIIFIIKKFINNGWIALLVQVGVGGIVYCLLSGIYVLCFSPMKKEVKELLFHKKK